MAVIAKERQSRSRDNKRAKGKSPIQVWLDENLIRKLDEMKTEEISSREAVLSALIAGTLHEERTTVQSRSQLSLL